MAEKKMIHQTFLDGDFPVCKLHTSLLPIDESPMFPSTNRRNAALASGELHAMPSPKSSVAVFAYGIAFAIYLLIHILLT